MQLYWYCHFIYTFLTSSLSLFPIIPCYYWLTSGEMKWHLALSPPMTGLLPSLTKSWSSKQLASNCPYTFIWNPMACTAANLSIQFPCLGSANHPSIQYAPEQPAFIPRPGYQYCKPSFLDDIPWQTIKLLNRTLSGLVSPTSTRGFSTLLSSNPAQSPPPYVQLSTPVYLSLKDKAR